MSIPRVIYLALTLFGLILPWYYNLQYMTETSGAFNIVRLYGGSSVYSRGSVPRLGPCDCLHRGFDLDVS